MAGNSPIYMPGFFAVAIAIWFWCAGKSLPRMLARDCFFLVRRPCVLPCWHLTGATDPLRLRCQEGFNVSHASSSGTWIAWAQGVYSLLTWSTVIIAARWSIRLNLQNLCWSLCT